MDFLLVIFKWILAVFLIAVLTSMVRIEVTKVMDHYFKLRLEYLKEFEKLATRPPERRSGSSYN